MTVRGDGAGGGAASVGVGVASAVGLTVVTVSGGSDGATAEGVLAARGAEVVTGASVVGVADVTIADTEPLSPPPRITPVVTTAMKRIAPATPATHIQRRSIRASS